MGTVHTTVQVAGSMVILVLLFGLVSGLYDSGVTPVLTTRTPAPVTTIPEDSNVTCCDTVLMSSPNRGAYSKNKYVGIYSLYTSYPSLNGRKVYIQKQCGNSGSYDLCLYWSSNSWKVTYCNKVIIGDDYFTFVNSSATSNKCPHGGDLDWKLSYNQDPTIKVSCIAGCSSAPPSSPSDRWSDWDGSTLVAGSVVTYTCKYPHNCVPVTAVCDPESLQWTPASLESVPTCDSPQCGETYTIPAPAPGITTSAPVTTVTEENPNVTCCDTVLMSSTDVTFHDMYCGYCGGIYSFFTSLNGRKVYKQLSCISNENLNNSPCLYWCGNAWRITNCDTAFMFPCNYWDLAKSSPTSNKCPHSGDLIWQYGNKNSSVKVSCITEVRTEVRTACSSAPPNSPSDRVSDWDGSSLTAGSVVTYTCTTGSCIPVTAVCDPESLQWTPTSLESVLACDSCNSGVTPAPTTTTPPPVTTTTPAPTTTTPTPVTTTMDDSPSTTTPVPVTTTTPAPTTTTPTPVTTTTDDSPAATTTPTYCGSRDQSTSNGRRPELKSAG